MRVHFVIRFSSLWGQHLSLSVNGGEAVPMQYRDAQHWELTVETEHGLIDYCYLLDGLPEKEIRHIHILPEDNELTVTDIWISPSAIETLWMTAPFTQVFFKHETEPAPAVKSCTFKVRAPLLPSGESLYLTGNIPELGGWDTEKAIRMSFCKDGYFTASVDIHPYTDIEYKYLQQTFEAGENRYIQTGNGRTIVQDNFTRFARKPWKGAGVAVPVFSLRSERGFGTGEFADIAQLAKWAQSSGQRMIQLLPVNDTIIDYSWKDSYPYAAISAYALHPLYIHLPAIGQLPPTYYQQQTELNKAAQLDYETVIREKMRYLRLLFDNFSPDAAFHSWVSEQQHWLDPYAVFCNKRDEQTHGLLFYYFVQYHLHLQLSEAVSAAHSLGIAIKGDLPIGVYRYGVDALAAPELFNMNVQAGAPPDEFSDKGQNWGFPTYNWQAMEATGYDWWRKRLRHMAQYFSAYRIDHILGMFRIWQIPIGQQDGILGHFSPALPFSKTQLLDWGIPLEPIAGKRYGYAANETSEEKQQDICYALFVEPEPGQFHPRFDMEQLPLFSTLDPSLQERLLDLRDHFFYHRHNALWEQEALRKLPVLQQASNMLVCGEDLGLVPDCVPGVMQRLGILSLEISQMPKRKGESLSDMPYRAVVSASTHDMSTVREWWRGDVQYLIRQHIQSPAMLCMLQLQDWLALDPSLPHLSPEEERINMPAVTPWYWRYRMPLTLEALMQADNLINIIQQLLTSSERN